jgi:hypothetical protein
MSSMTLAAARSLWQRPMTVLAHMLEPNDNICAWWPDLAAANDDGTCGAIRPSLPLPAGAAGDADPCDADDGPRAPATPWSMRDAQQHPTSASADGCPAYHGDLWADVLEYRAMRTRSLGGARLSVEQQERLDALGSRLLGQTDDVRRQFLRFNCRYRATIELSRGERFPTDVLDVSAGGAKVACRGEAQEGDPVVLELEAEGLVGSVLLPARIIWTRPGFVGLMFAGAPRWR